MFILGDYNTLRILRQTSIGLYLGDEEGQEVLLPKKYCPRDAAPGQHMQVFLYKDHEQRWIATTLKPLVRCKQFAFLRVKSVSSIGAFLDWGLEKDLFVPFREQTHKMQEGERHVVYVYEDPKSGRLTASAKINRYITDDAGDGPEPGQEVNVLVYGITPLGYNVIVNQTFRGLVYHDEVFREIRIGDCLKGYVKMVRDDGRLDISLQPKGLNRLEEGSEVILNYLKNNKGFLKLTDRSDADDIRSILHMSKKNFKQSLGILYKGRKVELKEDGVYLL